ncbi:hypothetical protein NQ317_001476 [Molorchus minor]|uniref:Uncharacterized protein n=1 Tax=Molorchus minor TaxID=1323400 RepID=A0ABQ9JWI5_9CUCU|nr:hypothetical protein NQ317_001476 [Molorchus minor]
MVIQRYPSFDTYWTFHVTCLFPFAIALQRANRRTDELRCKYLENGLVLAPAVGPCSTIHQRFIGDHVLQVTDIVQAMRRLGRYFRPPMRTTKN